MKTAGVVLDFYDDLGGDLLRRSFPTPDVLPDVIKTAHILSSEERDILRDEAYALVMKNEGKTLRKFACVDPGNTLLSALYLSENADRLPEEAVKVAAANIQSACEFFKLPIESLEKIAGRKNKATDATAKGVARQRDPMRQPLVGDEADWNERTNLVSVRGGADSGRVIPMANQMKTAAAQKGHSVFRSAIREGWEGAKKGWKDQLHHNSRAADAGEKAEDKAMAKSKKRGMSEDHALEEGDVAHHEAYDKYWDKKKTAQDHVDDAQEKADNKRDGFKPKAPSKKDAKKAAEKIDYLKDFHKLNPEAKPTGPVKTANVVDVSGLEAPVLYKKASSNHMALNQYPLDSYADVKAAVRFFDDNHLALTPEERHDFAVKTASRADELGIELTDLLDRYGSVEYSVDVEAHLSNRRMLSPEHAGLFDTLQEKRASIEPDEFVKLLSEADEVAGLNWYYGGHLADPFYATFGGNKVKEANATWSWQSRTGDYVSGDQLKKLALNGRPLVAKQFEPSLAAAFSKDPITIFESLPDLQKKILARLASQEFDGTPNN